MNGHVVGIIGATSTGLALARLVSSIGIEVAIAGSPEAANVGGLVHATTLKEAADPEIVVLAAEFDSVPQILAQVRNWDARILVDATRPSARNAISQSRRVADLAPGAQVIKSLGSSPSAVFERPMRSPDLQHVIFMCGDHLRAKRQFTVLLDRLDFHGIDLGDLDDGSRLLDLPDGALSGATLLAERTAP